MLPWAWARIENSASTPHASLRVTLKLPSRRVMSSQTVFTQILLLKGFPLISTTTLDRRKASHANYFSITITTNDPGITGGRRRGFDAVDSAGAAPIFALTTKTPGWAR